MTKHLYFYWKGGLKYGKEKRKPFTRINGKNRNEKPIRQNWGWSTIVDIGNPWQNWEDDKYGFGTVGIVTVGGAGFSFDSGKKVNRFVVDKLKEFGYTVLYEHFSC